MAFDDGEEKDYRIGNLSYFQTGIIFLFLASAVLVFVAYQLKVGRVFTKSGDLPLSESLAKAFLTLETIAAVVGIVLGVKMVKRD